MLEWLWRRENHNDDVYMPQVLRHLHELTTFLHSERVA